MLGKLLRCYSDYLARRGLNERLSLQRLIFEDVRDALMLRGLSAPSVRNESVKRFCVSASTSTSIRKSSPNLSSSAGPGCILQPFHVRG